MLGISGDSLDTHRQFSEKYDIEFPLIADERNTLSRQFGGGRVTFLVDRAGIIRFIRKGVPDNRELLAELEKLQP